MAWARMEITTKYAESNKISSGSSPNSSWNPMKATDSRQLSIIASRTLKFVGIILVLAALLDYVILLIPSDVPDNLGSLEGVRWQISLLSQIVDRGIVPLIGFVLLLAGLWVDSVSGAPQPRQKTWQTIGLGAALLSSLLGLVFVLVAPLHFNNTNRANQLTQQQIAKEATQAEGQLTAQLDQISGLLKGDSQINQAIESGQLKGDQLAQVQTLREQLQKQLQSDPQALDKRAKEAQTQILSRRLNLENRYKAEYLKSGLRVGLSSLLLAAGYITVGWTALRELGGGRKAAR